MLKALSIKVSQSHSQGLGRGTALRAALAAAVMLALGAGEAAASARTVPQRAAEALQLAGWEGGQRHVQPLRVVPRVYGPGIHRDKRHAFHGHAQGHGQGYGQGHKTLQHRGGRYYGAACRPVKVVGWHYGHRALFGQVVCVNRFGQRSTLRGSRYLIRYLYR
jgi:hypothetical protein